MRTLKLSSRIVEGARSSGTRRHDQCQRSAGAPSQTARVRVRGGYIPAVIHAEAGTPVVIIFERDETAPCSERVVFPSLGKTATLPVGREVVVEVFPPGPGEYEFTCAMNMLRGRLLVHEGDRR